MPSGKEFPPEAQSAAQARSYVRTLLADCDQELADAVVLLTSELVSNAIVHSGTSVTVDVSQTCDQVRVSVSDHGLELPELHHPGPFDSNGRGLSIVNEVSDSWGVEHKPDGKTVWFDVTSSRSPSQT